MKEIETIFSRNIYTKAGTLIPVFCLQNPIKDIEIFNAESTNKKTWKDRESVSLKEFIPAFAV